MSVAIATKVFGSEVLVGLIQFFRTHPQATQSDAMRHLELAHQTVSHNTRILLQAGVLEVLTPKQGRTGGTYAVDEERVDMLVRELRKYLLVDDPQ